MGGQSAMVGQSAEKAKKARSKKRRGILSQSARCDLNILRVLWLRHTHDAARAIRPSRIRRAFLPTLFFFLAPYFDADFTSRLHFVARACGSIYFFFSLLFANRTLFLLP